MAYTALCAIAANIIFYVLGLAVLLPAVLAVSKKTGRKNVCYLAVLFYVLSYIHSVDQVKPLSEHSYIEEHSPQVSAMGTVSAVTQKQGYCSAILKNAVITLNGQEDKRRAGSILLTVQSPDFCVGDIVVVTGRVKTFEKSRNEGQFDSRRYYLSVGICYKLAVEAVEIKNTDRDSFAFYLSVFRKKMNQVYEQIGTGTDSGIFSSIVLGDKTSLDSDIKKLYQQNGIAHLLAISGLHISLIGMSLYKLLRRLGFGFGSAFISGGLFVISYGLLTGNGVSAIRAVVMCLLLMLSELLGRTYDCLSALGAAACFLLWENPFVLLNSGFLLSFGAILGIALVVPALETIFSSKQEKPPLACLRSSLFVSVSVNLATFPVILNNYYEFPLYAVLLNLVVIPLMSIVMLSAVLAGVAGLFCPAAGVFFIGTAHYILKLYEILCQFVLKLPYAVVVTGKPEVWQIAAYALLMVLFLAAAKWEKLSSQKAMLLLPVLAVVLLVSHRRGGFEIDMIDVGQGDGILMTTPQGQVYLFDGGSSDEEKLEENILLPLLKSKGLQTIDYAVVSHSDMDHISGLLSFIRKGTFAVKTVVLPEIKNYREDENYCTLLLEAQKQGIEVCYAKAGARIGEGEVRVECLHPAADYDYTSANDYSAVYQITYKEFQMLMMGDTEEKAERAMIQAGVLSDIDVLKAGHHGSKTSSSPAFLAAVRPETALISCGEKNRYHHPSDEVLNRFHELGIQTYVTAQCGELVITSDGKTYQIGQWN